MRWYNLEKIETPHEDSRGARVDIGPDSPWFSGHFPEDPVLPGIAQLAMVLQTLRSFLGSVRVTGVRRVRFKQVLRPGDPIEIIVKESQQGDGGDHLFQIKTGENIASSGIMTVERIAQR